MYKLVQNNYSLNIQASAKFAAMYMQKNYLNMYVFTFLENLCFQMSSLENVILYFLGCSFQQH